jgi:hypothetical protein
MKRYLHKMNMLRTWMLLVLISPVIYLSVKAFIPDIFTVSQDISIPQDVPVALSTSPNEFQTLSWFTKHQDEFFLDLFTIRTLYNQLNPNTIEDQKNNASLAFLISRIKDTMSIKTTKENITRIVYLGKDKQSGQTFVEFYAKRLIQKAEEGIKRKEMQSRGEALPENQVRNRTLSTMTSSSIAMREGIIISEQKSFWRNDRMVPALSLLIIGLIVFMISIGFAELFDHSFKSERQVAAYLQLPILGELPNLTKMSQSIGIKKTG